MVIKVGCQKIFLILFGNFFVLLPIFLPVPGNSGSKTISTQRLLNVKAYETLAKLESRNDSNEILGKYVDYHFEASEYEKKLIQV